MKSVPGTQSDAVVERYSHRRGPLTDETTGEGHRSEIALHGNAIPAPHRIHDKAKAWTIKHLKKALITAIRLAAALAFIAFAMFVISTRG